MNIIVCLKPIQSMSVDSFNPGYRLSISAQDMNTLQQAMRIKNCGKGDDCKVIVVAMSRMAAKDCLNQLYEYGVDRVYLLTNQKLAGADTIATAYTLGNFLRTIEYDYVLTGFQSGDSETGFVPPALAEELGIKCMMNVEIDSIFSVTGLAIRRYYENSIVSVNLKDPAVLSIRFKGNSIMRPCFCNILENTREVSVVTTFDCDENRVGISGSKTKVESVKSHTVKNRQGMVYGFERGMAMLQDCIYETQAVK
ncbi:caffeyl-CoA reductase-Etf complex subunit CarD [Lachnospiraceae bacterium]|nr:caffeyl-CoA reductase-Etf complex subunit CarD [Lachnospiraceae bacterium]